VKKKEVIVARVPRWFLTPAGPAAAVPEFGANGESKYNPANSRRGDTRNLNMSILAPANYISLIRKHGFVLPT
jgi:hypothetical protein